MSQIFHFLVYCLSGNVVGSVTRSNSSNKHFVVWNRRCLFVWFLVFMFIIIITLICSILKLTFRLSCISIARHRFRCTCFCFFSRTQNDASGCWDPSVAPLSSSLRFLSCWGPGIIEVRSCSRHPPLNKVKSRSLNLCNGCLCASPSPFFCDMWTLWKK